MRLQSSSEEQTKTIGAALAQSLSRVSPTVFIQLQGTLGAGKSTLARGFISQWSLIHDGREASTITSPTFNLVRLYGEKKPVAHFDLYRIKSLEELEQLGFEQYFYETPACLVEWLELIPQAPALIPASSLLVAMGIDPGNSHKRWIEISGALEDEIGELLF